MSYVRRKKPALLKADVFRLVNDLIEFMDTARAVNTWLGELPEPVLAYLNQMYHRGAAATTRRERVHALWCGDCWFFLDEDNDRLAAHDWLMEEGDAWLRRDPRNRPQRQATLREVRRILRAPERDPD